VRAEGKPVAHRAALVQQQLAAAELQEVVTEASLQQFIDQRTLVAQEMLAQRRAEPVRQRLPVGGCVRGFRARGFHARIVPRSLDDMNVEPAMISVFPLPAFRDNYIWVARRDDGQAFVVDPGDASVVEDYLGASGTTLAAILLTHHHADHTGGVEALLRRHPVPVYGPREARMPMVSHTLADGDVLDLCGLKLEVLAVPGHTREHIALYCARPDTADARPLVFCGDTLFAA